MTTRMNDLIYRQDAIDIADEIIARDTSGNNDVVKAMEAWKVSIKFLPSAQKWIPCSERLPENEDYVLVTTSIGDVTEAKYWHGEQLWVKNLTVLSVTAWMPLPEPWKGEEAR